MDKSELKERLNQCEKEEKLLCFPTFTNSIALEIGTLLIKNTQIRNAAVAIDITINSTEVFHYCFPGTTDYNNLWIERKKKMVHTKHISSLHAGYLLEYNNWILRRTGFWIRRSLQ